MNRRLFSRIALSCAVAAFVFGENYAASQEAESAGAESKEKVSAPGAASDSDAKLDAGLNLVARQFVKSRGEIPKGLEDAKQQILRSYGISQNQDNPSVEVGITGSVTEEELKKLGIVVRYKLDETIYATVPVKVLSQLSGLKGVETVNGIQELDVPKPPKLNASNLSGRGISSRGGELDDTFDHQGLSGKGVIVGVVDSGIDWRHPDFVRANGKSRILYLWDMSDPSYEDSNHTVGSVAPQLDLNGKSLGTLYTNEQITAALRGKGKVGSFDTFGHGTACAGVAAGNGRATANGVPKGTYKGVAPEADLIIVRAADGEDRIRTDAHSGVQWIVAQSQALGRPCAINLSYGGHYGPHDGSTQSEKSINSLSGPGKPGVVICVAGGNERSQSMHAGGRFGPDREGAYKNSSTIELNVAQVASLNVFFDKGDDWVFKVTGDGDFLRDEVGNSIELQLWKSGRIVPAYKTLVDGMDYTGSISPGDDYPASLFVQNFVSYTHNDGLNIRLPRGRYLVEAFGRTAEVSNGRFDMYVAGGTFGQGSQHEFMIGTPGTAKNAITVGAYDFRTSWPSITGTDTFFNLETGGLANYSNPGYSRDGTIKPDIVAPATFAISAMARSEDGKNVMMGSEGADMLITKDGYHIAWMGTSSATPFVTGVVALMLEKNPKLDAEQVRKILAKSATSDTKTGGTPNRDWGYGKINPVLSLTNTATKIGDGTN